MSNQLNIMIILTLRSDKPEAEIGLYAGDKQLAYTIWPAHRELAETIHDKLRELLADQQMQLKDIQAIAAYKGPGSFTGLRIGLSVANALAFSLQIPIVSATGANWIKTATKSLVNGANEAIALPQYDSPPHITQPKR